MEKRIKDYLKSIDELLEKLESGNAAFDEHMVSEHLIQIGFFQHERLIHLIVTVLFALMELISVCLAALAGGIAAIALALVLLILLIPYVRHYYILENGVQKMYRQYDRLISYRL